MLPFHGDTIEDVRTPDGRAVAHLKRLCESIGLDFATQYRKLTSEDCDWAGIVIMTTPDQRGCLQQLAMIDHESIPLWLAGISPRKV